jgi:hypothetical protein
MRKIIGLPLILFVAISAIASHGQQIPKTAGGIKGNKGDVVD